jgi:hypothetical protein
MQHKLKYNLYYSILIVVVCIAIAILFHGNKESYNSIDSKHNGIIDPGFVIFLLTHYVGLWSGVGVLALRVLKVIDHHSFIYIFVAVLDAFLGISGVVLYTGNELALPLLKQFIYNLVIGMILIIDIFFLKILFQNKA